MSGLIKGIGKTFKKVVKVVKKVAPYALAAGAIVLTGGAALGALPAVGTVIGGLGLSAGVTATLTSAVTAAGIGGGVGLLTGGTKGMVKGAAVGAISGGLLGAAGAGLNAGAGTLSAPLTSNASIIANSPTLSGASPIFGGAASGGAAAAGGGIGGGVGAGGGGLGSVFGGGSGISGLLNNPTIVSSALQGLGAGVTNKAESKAAQAAIERRAANYALQPGGGMLNAPAGAAPGPTYGMPARPTPAERWDALSLNGEYVLDPVQGRVVRRITTPAGA